MIQGTSTFAGHWMMGDAGKRLKKFDWSGSLRTKRNGKVDLAVRTAIDGRRRSLKLRDTAPATLTETPKFKRFVRSMTPRPFGKFGRRRGRTGTRTRAGGR